MSRRDTPLPRNTKGQVVAASWPKPRWSNESFLSDQLNSAMPADTGAGKPATVRANAVRQTLSSLGRLPDPFLDLPSDCQPLTIRELSPNGYDTFEVISAEDATRLAEMDDATFDRLINSPLVCGGTPDLRDRPARDALRPASGARRSEVRPFLVVVLLWISIVAIGLAIVGLVERHAPGAALPPPLPAHVLSKGDRLT